MALTPRDKRALMILGGAAVVGVLVLFVMMLGGGDGERAATTPPAGTQPLPEATATPTPREASPRELTFTGRDPFSPPVVLVSPSGGASPSSTVSPTQSPTGGGDGGPSQNVGGRDVTLLNIFTRNGELRAQVEVDGTVYTVSEGETFAANYELDSFTSQSCARFLYGDEPFTLCESTGK